MSQVITVQEQLINTIAQRWGLYFGKKAYLSSLMKEAAKERVAIRKAKDALNEALEQLINGKGDRSAVLEAKERLKAAKEAYEQKVAPIKEKMKPINEALSFLDNAVIPKMLEQVLGKKVEPILQVDVEALKKTIMG